MTDIFAPALGSSNVHSTIVGKFSKQHNLNDLVNTYSAIISFTKPFADQQYMVFANSVLSYGTVENDAGERIG